MQIVAWIVVACVAAIIVTYAGEGVWPWQIPRKKR
jgi:hypothetical protein